MIKKFINETINQHYISQAEQRLNAINPKAKPSKQRIYSFNIVNRESFKIELENDKGMLIENNLSIFDLYSFDVDDESKKLRYNFELLFNKYESNIIIHTKSLLKKIDNRDKDILNELFNIFILKTLNSLRNPFCIKKTINTLKPILQYIPTDKKYQETYRKIINGEVKHLNYLYNLLGVSKEQYKLWLKGLFMLLIEFEHKGEKINMLESFARNIYENKDNYKTITINCYDNHSVLLSDRGFNSIEDNVNSIIEFNLSSSSFIIYSFTNLNKFAESQGWISDNHNKMIERCKEVQGNIIHVYYDRNNIELLNRYNKRTIYQAHSHVYSAKKSWR
ncbi:hypothetical protein [Gilliamella sp. ESL0254]|uniref:hypothetical protein n=1 Tax=Gilliamella sp. ESL0254 TaxID=2705035 RepID=UPI00157FEE0D|nr:hypothetical protein [Gilliamella sp. ESL0254]NUF27040.1 hypothetical protein [Gilliamella sp. ESL0254]